MADIDLKTEAPDTTLPSTGFLFGADSQSAASPSVYSTQAVATALLGSTSLTGATVTTSQPVLDLAQTWNASGVTFTGLRFNVPTDSSAAGSLLMDLQVGGSSRFKVSKDGGLTIQGGGTLAADGTALYINRSVNSSGAIANTFSGPVQVAASSAFQWSDLFLTRRAAANLRLGAADAAAPVAQTLSVQSGTAGASALSCSISGTTLTVGGAVTGTIAIGHAVTGTGVSAGTVITAGSGTTWTVNNSQTVSSTTMYFNSVGQNLTITGSQGSGPSAGGSIVFQVAPAGSAGTTAQNALATALTINPSGTVSIGGLTIDPSNGGITFAQTFGITMQTSNAFTIRHGNGDGLDVRPVSSGSPNIILKNASSAIQAALWGEATNTLALRNGANAQTFRVYNTTDGTNGNWLELAGGAFSGVYPRIAGTGTNSGLIVAGSATGNSAPLYLRFQYNQNGWRIDTAGNLLAETDNSYDIGASGATRPRDVYVAGKINTGGDSVFAGGTFGAYYSQTVVGMYSTTKFGWTAGAVSATLDTGLKRSSAAVVGVTNGSTGGGAVELQEMTAPTAPATNNVRIYAEDNGSGKTRLMALFATGAAVQIAIEP